MKHLSVRAKTTPNSDTFTLEITEQTHFFNHFGGGQPTPYFFRNYLFQHGNVVLASANEPELVADKSYITDDWGLPPSVDYIVLVRGVVRGKVSDSYQIKDIPCELWKDIRAAVIAYNNFYLDKD